MGEAIILILYLLPVSKLVKETNWFFVFNNWMLHGNNGLRSLFVMLPSIRILVFCACKGITNSSARMSRNKLRFCIVMLIINYLSDADRMNFVRTGLSYNPWLENNLWLITRNIKNLFKRIVNLFLNGTLLIFLCCHGSSSSPWHYQFTVKCILYIAVLRDKRQAYASQPARQDDTGCHGELAEPWPWHFIVKCILHRSTAGQATGFRLTVGQAGWYKLPWWPCRTMTLQAPSP